jgi:murein DD-endopeptidase MepM/ murein hydrolase activator NlpD
VAAGLTDNLIMQLADLFQWDISFALDLREGDVFKVIVERSSIGGQPIGEDRILGASFDNFGTEHVGLRYIDSNARMGYYTPEGASLRKAFLRDPVHFSHVSSSFNLRRKHPIHNRTMPHRGIDYAANRGTPVRAAGEGKILKAERNEASGNFIVVRHGERYTTKYLHLSKFARGIKAGTRVKQGQTIGYVGATGWATGPHLHYEFLVDGIHRNPRTVRLPNSSPVPEREIASFKAAVGSIILALRQPGDSSLRMAQRSETNSLGD